MGGEDGGLFSDDFVCLNVFGAKDIHNRVSLLRLYIFSLILNGYNVCPESLIMDVRGSGNGLFSEIPMMN